MVAPKPPVSLGFSLKGFMSGFIDLLGQKLKKLIKASLSNSLIAPLFILIFPYFASSKPSYFLAERRPIKPSSSSGYACQVEEQRLNDLSMFF